MTAEEVAERFNAEHSIGTAVTAFPGTKDGRAIEGKTRTKAWVVGDQPVVSITGFAGGIHLSHVVCAIHPTHAVEVAP